MGVVNSGSDPKGREIRGDDKTDTMHPSKCWGALHPWRAAEAGDDTGQEGILLPSKPDFTHAHQHAHAYSLPSTKTLLSSWPGQDFLQCLVGLGPPAVQPSS